MHEYSQIVTKESRIGGDYYRQRLAEVEGNCRASVSHDSASALDDPRTSAR